MPFRAHRRRARVGALRPLPPFLWGRAANGSGIRADGLVSAMVLRCAQRPLEYGTPVAKQIANKRGARQPGADLPQRFVDSIDAGKAQTQLLLKGVAQYANWETGECYPSFTTLAKIGKCSRKTVQRHLRKMHARGIIKLEERFDTEGSGRQSSNTISLVGYAAWVATLRADGVVAKPKIIPGQVDQGPTDILTRAPGQQVPTAPGHLLSTLDPSLESSSEQTIPPTPRQRGAREKIDLVLKVRSERPDCSRAIDKLLVPLLAKLHYDAPNPALSIGTIADFAEKQTDEVLDKTLSLLTEPGARYRRSSVKPSDIEDAIRDAEKHIKLRAELAANDHSGPLLFQGSPAFNAAIAQVAERNAAHAESLRSRSCIRRSEIKEYGVDKAES